MDYIYTNNTDINFKNIKIWWLKPFIPKLFLKNYNDLPIQILKKYSIKVLACDMDNTLVPYYKGYPNLKTKNFVKKIQQNDIKFILVSNNFKERVQKFAKNLNVDDYYYFCKKPYPKVLKRISQKYNVRNSEIMVMGDQLLTDILMANIFGAPSILVLPLLNYDSKIGFVDILDKLIYSRLAKYHIIPKTDNIESDSISANTKELKWF